MSGNVVLVSYSEIALKGSYVRRMLENRLMRHIRFFLKQAGIQGDVRRILSRIIVKTETCDEAARLISSRVLGAAYTAVAIEIEPRLENIIASATKLGVETLEPNQTFAVRTKRAFDHKFRSIDVEREVGTQILNKLAEKGVEVNLSNPDKVIHVEVREKNAYIYGSIYEGLRGIPTGSQGKLIGLISGGIDSPVAAWLMMKRGAFVAPLFLDQRPFVGNDYFEKAVDTVKKLHEYVPAKRYCLYVAPMGKIMKTIVEDANPRYTCILCKRMMYRIACSLAEKSKAYGIVTGESLGQVASQTLINLSVLNDTATLPIHRPLIGLDKEDAVNLGKKIGTYNISVRRTHGCSAVPSHPATKAELSEIKRSEERLNVKELVDEALSGIYQIPV